MNIFCQNTRLGSSAWTGLSSGGTACFTTVYRQGGGGAQRSQRKAYCWETRWGRSACLVSSGPGRQGHRGELVLRVNNTGHWWLKGDFCNPCYSNANPVIRRWLAWGTLGAATRVLWVGAVLSQRASNEDPRNSPPTRLNYQLPGWMEEDHSVDAPGQNHRAL